ncbi:hypothetical protein WKW79_32260 [Variovorax robiniae]|uniref:Uncharacterized protein n=1 Tax=Variovorax robiniae TaxID=1836199 RepID=A0ABU8XJJ6_9BURK
MIVAALIAVTLIAAVYVALNVLIVLAIGRCASSIAARAARTAK